MTNKWNYKQVRTCTNCRWYSSSSCILLNEVLPIGVCEAFQKRGGGAIKNGKNKKKRRITDENKRRIHNKTNQKSTA